MSASQRERQGRKGDRRADGALLRGLWIGLAALCFVLGLAGVVLPLLPTTPFMLLAAGLASKGSPRFARWIRTHPVAGPAITNWEQERAISAKARCLAVLLIGCSAVAVMFMLDTLWLALVIVFGLSLLALWLGTRPSPSQPSRE
ncbi:YbaN family protein [Kushneria phosphatilytica]|uniref:Inner membrane protein n=1 Tax=Kushneria phosphatilytica TaxID=657387 RepID=A0A1S1NYP1_9GAMM|nr:YbaN family protein [Kushneria phosphatilytica]OHV12893.1 hypothetical protein BH688_02450 [Kushneria phosphatilytica]QEL10753.1 DUF454 domain-containing protein [Kushneria phosphatilytica]